MTRLSDNEQWTFTWDYHNRMTQAVEKTSAGVTVTNDVFTYDVEDRRIGKSTNGTQVWFGYSDVVAPTGSGMPWRERFKSSLETADTRRSRGSASTGRR
jgi:hypothetical protein